MLSLPFTMFANIKESNFKKLSWLFIQAWRRLCRCFTHMGEQPIYNNSLLCFFKRLGKVLIEQDTSPYTWNLQDSRVGMYYCSIASQPTTKIEVKKNFGGGGERTLGIQMIKSGLEYEYWCIRSNILIPSEYRTKKKSPILWKWVMILNAIKIWHIWIPGWS